MAAKLRKGDKVVVLAGKDKAKRVQSLCLILRQEKQWLTV